MVNDMLGVVGVHGSMTAAVHTNPDEWIAQIFAAKAVEKGRVLRRSVAWVRNEVGTDRFVNEVRNRGFHLLETGGQFIVICNPAPIRRVL